jgi:hypothetical protein
MSEVLEVSLYIVLYTKISLVERILRRQIVFAGLA